MASYSFLSFQQELWINEHYGAKLKMITKEQLEQKWKDRLE